MKSFHFCNFLSNSRLTVLVIVDSCHLAAHSIPRSFFMVLRPCEDFCRMPFMTFLHFTNSYTYTRFFQSGVIQFYISYLGRGQKHRLHSLRLCIGTTASVFLRGSFITCSCSMSRSSFSHLDSILLSPSLTGLCTFSILKCSTEVSCLNSTLKVKTQAIPLS